MRLTGERVKLHRRSGEISAIQILFAKLHRLIDARKSFGVCLAASSFHLKDEAAKTLDILTTSEINA
jgi:hypothetical protein